MDPFHKNAEEKKIVDALRLAFYEVVPKISPTYGLHQHLDVASIYVYRFKPGFSFLWNSEHTLKRSFFLSIVPRWSAVSSCSTAGDLRLGLVTWNLGNVPF